MVNPGYQWYRHVAQLEAVLERVASGDIKRLMVFEPPRHGKSEQVSRLFSAYYLSCHPDHWVGINSYAADLAYTFSRAARDNYTRFGGHLSDSAGAVNHWETGQGGGMWAAGVGGPITGKGFHLGIIDDPLKNAEEAGSETIREKQKDWYLSAFSTRQEPDAAIIVIQTRWHQDDLSGWLLAQEDGDEPEHWHVVSFPAISEADPPSFPDTCTVEPDPREPGEALCPERYSLERLRSTERRLGPYFWAALYQQRPAPREGNRFKRHWFEMVDAVPYEAQRVRYWDTGATEGAGDYTVGLLMARYGGTFYVEDVVRGQWSSGERNRIIRATAEADHFRYLHSGGVHQVREQEPGSAGKDVALDFVQMLAGFSASAKPSSGDKGVRADPLASQAEAGNVKLLRASWNLAWLDEICSFPAGAHDDQVDAASGAFNELALGMMPVSVGTNPLSGWRG